MRILFVLEHYYPYIGGAETLFYQLTTQLALRGHHIAVLTTQHQLDLAKYEVEKGVHLYRISCKNRFLFTLKAIGPAIHHAKGYDLIHTSSYTAAIPAQAAARYHRIPISITFHEIWSKLWFEVPYLNPFQRIAYFLFEQLVARLPYHQMVAVSDDTKRKIHSIKPKAKVQRIYNGIDYSEFESYQHNPKKPFTALFLGRLGVSKGINFVIEAGTAFLRKYEDALIMLILPEYPKAFSRKISKRINASGVADRLIRVPSLSWDKLRSTMATASVILIPSYSEGFGYVGLEAQAIGVPIIHSGRAALQETIGGQNIKMKDLSANALLGALERASIGDWEYLPSHKFNLSDSVDAYIQLFENLRD